MKKAFTLLELVIVIAVVGILSLLLFRTVSDMMRANARIQQEKILAQELITLQTTLNHLAETYPYIDYSKYTTTTDSNKTTINNDGTTAILHLTDDPDPNSTTKKTVNIFSDTCQSTDNDSNQPSCLSYTITTNSTSKQIAPTRIHITNPDRTTVTNISFQLLPTQPYKYNQYENDQFTPTTISHPGFWLLGTLSHTTTNSTKAKTSYQLQHFINLKYKHFDQPTNQTSTTAQ